MWACPLILLDFRGFCAGNVAVFNPSNFLGELRNMSLEGRTRVSVPEGSETDIDPF